MDGMRLRELLDDATSLAPSSDLDPAVLWRRGRRANRRSAALVALGIAVVLVAAGLMWVTASGVVGRPVPPANPSTHQTVRFPEHVYAIPSHTATTADAGPIGPLAFIGSAQHVGFWPWERSDMLYGVSGVDGTYRFLSLPGFDGCSKASFSSVCALSPNGRWLSYSYGHVAHRHLASTGFAVYDTVTGHVQRFSFDTPHGVWVEWVTWSPDSTQVAVGLARVGPPNGAAPMRARMIDVGTGRIWAIPRSKTWFDHVTWRPRDGSDGQIATLGRGVRLFSPQSGRLLGAVQMPVPNVKNPLWDANYPTWSPDGAKLAVRWCHDKGCPAWVVAVPQRHGDARLAAVVAKHSRRFVPMGWADDQHLVLRTVGPKKRYVTVDVAHPKEKTAYATLDVWLKSVARDVFTHPTMDTPKPGAFPWFWVVAPGVLVGLVVTGWGLWARRRV